MVVTEFLNPPEASIWNVADADGTDADQAISWGATSLGRGKAFSLNGADVPAVVRKQYVNINGRYFLFEKVRYRDIEQSLSSLPEQASNAKRLPGMASMHLRLPKTPSAKSASRPIRLALGDMSAKGYVLDYVSLNAAYTNFTFQGDTTYYVSGPLSLYGTNTFEGGTVIKYTNGASIAVAPGPPPYSTPALNWRAAAYHPVVCTAFSDNTIGETINVSTGNPSGYYANPALSLVSLTTAIDGLRVLYAQQVFQLSGATLALSDAQFVNCLDGINSGGSSLKLENALFVNAVTNFVPTGGDTYNLQNVTISGSGGLVAAPSAPSGSGISVSLTNCILANITNLYSGVMQSFAGDYNGFYNSPTFGNDVKNSSVWPFQTVGAGSFYLTNNSPFHNVGTTNIDPNLSADLAQKTTYTPIVYSNVTFSVPMAFNPQAQRDTNSNPDLGYHYDPLDYVFGAAIAQSNITFAAGTAVGFFYNSGGGTYGLALGDSVTASFNGTVTSPCRWARHWTVQEGNGNWTAASWLGGITGQSYSHAAPAIVAQFLDGYELAQEGNLFRDDWTLLVETARNCEFYSGRIGAYYASLNLTNCLFVNGGVTLFDNYGAANLTMENCTMFRSDVTADGASGYGWPVTIVNCAFDKTLFYMSSGGATTNGYYYTDYNSFLVNSNTTLYLGGHEVFVTNSYNWQTSWLGNYYQLTNSPLIDKGSTRANQLGLYHFTTQTNQMKETNSIVDIGYHYVATDQYGNPLDSNGNGVPDYLEDTCGCGQPLTVTLLSPTNNTSYAEPANIPLQVSVFDWRSVVTNVSFLNGSLSIVAVTNAPFQGTWPVVAAGVYSVSATASDLAGAATNSATASVTVTNLCSH